MENNIQKRVLRVVLALTLVCCEELEQQRCHFVALLQRRHMTATLDHLTHSQMTISPEKRPKSGQFDLPINESGAGLNPSEHSQARKNRLEFSICMTSRDLSRTFISACGISRDISLVDPSGVIASYPSKTRAKVSETHEHNGGKRRDQQKKRGHRGENARIATTKRPNTDD